MLDKYRIIILVTQRYGGTIESGVPSLKREEILGPGEVILPDGPKPDS